MKIIKLTPAEMAVAGLVASMRRIKAIELNRKPRYGAPMTVGVWDMEMNSCFAEMGVAKHFNKYWAPAVGVVGIVDVGGVIEVRSRQKAGHRLIMHQDDHDDRPYVLVHIEPPIIGLVGWLMGGEAKNPEWWSDPQGTNRHAFFVPDGALHSIDELVPEVLARAAA
jgi:hypothetical protein